LGPFRGLGVLALLVEVAQSCGLEFWKVFLNIGAGEHGPGGKIAKTCHVKKLDSVGDGSDGYNAVGETVGLLGFLMMFVKFDTPKAGARFAVSCEDDVGAKLDVDVGLGEVNFAAAVAQECNGYGRVVEFFENVANSGFWWEGWQAELAFVGCLEDFSVRDFGLNTVWGRCEVGDGALDCEVIAGGATVEDCIVVEGRGGLTGVVS
jgi:hypothetical protein